MNEIQLSDRLLKVLEKMFIPKTAEKIHDMIFDPKINTEEIVDYIKTLITKTKDDVLLMDR